VKHALPFLTLLIAVLLTACGCAPAPGNNRLGPSAVSTIRNGITTKEQVRALLGAPQSTERQQPIRQPSGVEPLPVKYTASEIWAYWTDVNPRHLFSISASTKQERYLVVIYFNERGVVLDCQTEVTNS
jgi:hypothetical protein